VRAGGRRMQPRYLVAVALVAGIAVYLTWMSMAMT
jgi:hypothetical protein